MKKYHEVIIAPLWAVSVCVLRIPGTGPSRTHPIADTVGRQGIMIPGQFAFFGRHPAQASLRIFPEPAIPHLIFTDFALIHAEIAGDSLGVFRRPFRQPEFRPGS